MNGRVTECVPLSSRAQSLPSLLGQPPFLSPDVGRKDRGLPRVGEESDARLSLVFENVANKTVKLLVHGVTDREVIILAGCSKRQTVAAGIVSVTAAFLERAHCFESRGYRVFLRRSPLTAGTVLRIRPELWDSAETTFVQARSLDHALRTLEEVDLRRCLQQQLPRGTACSMASMSTSGDAGGCTPVPPSPRPGASRAGSKGLPGRAASAATEESKPLPTPGQLPTCFFLPCDGSIDVRLPGQDVWVTGRIYGVATGVDAAYPAGALLVECNSRAKLVLPDEIRTVLRARCQAVDLAPRLN